MSLIFFGVTIENYPLFFTGLPQLLHNAFKLSLMMETDDVYISIFKIDDKIKFFPTLKNSNILFCEEFKYSEAKLMSQIHVKKYNFDEIEKIPGSISDFIDYGKNNKPVERACEEIPDAQKNILKQKLFEEAYKIIFFKPSTDKHELFNQEKLRDEYNQILDVHKNTSYSFDDYCNGWRVDESGLMCFSRVHIVDVQWRIPGLIQAQHKGVRSIKK